MAENVMLQEAIEAIRQGQHRRARDLLTRLLKADQTNPEYWLWMSSVVDTTKERIYCLNNVLKYDPKNKAARRGLILAGALPPGTDVQPVPPVRRAWSVDEQEIPAPTGLAAIWANPILRVAIFAGAGLLVVALILGGIFGFGARRGPAVSSLPTRTPGPSPTFTATPTFINNPTAGVTPSPTFVGPTPLWMLLEETFTPTPRYVDTPHPASEAFRVAMRAVERQDWEQALQFFEQAAETESDMADIPFHIGEIYRQIGEDDQAIDAYNLALEIDENFAPAYLGRARARVAINPRTDVIRDLDAAIEADPNYTEAILERTAYHLEREDVEAAQEDLEKLETLAPDSALRYLYLAKVSMARDDRQTALTAARRANRLDLTLLDTYLIIAQAALINGQSKQAQEAVETYLLYAPDDPAGLIVIGQIQYENGEYEQALETLENARRLDPGVPGIYLYRGLTYLELGEGERAVNDLLAARRYNPRSFNINLSLAEAYLAAGRLGEALEQVTNAEDYAQSDAQLAEAYYLHVQVLNRIGNAPAAKEIWNLLLELPEEDVPESWRLEAEEALAATATPTLTFTPTTTNTPTSTKTFTPTPTSTSTLTLTPSPTPSPAGGARTRPPPSRSVTPTPR